MKLGVYRGAGSDGAGRIPAFAAFMGRDPDVIIDFVASDTWANFEGAGGWAAWCWKNSPYVGKQFCFTVPLVTAESRGDFAGVIAGRYDAHFRAYFKSVHDQGFPLPPIFRIGHEANGGWYPWAAAGHEKLFAQAFDHVAQLAKAAAPGCKTYLCFAQGWQQTVAYADMVPATVPDYIGWDVYAKGAWGKGKPTTAQVIAELSHNYTFDFFAWFMAQYPTARFAAAEVGIGDDSNGIGPGDDAGSANWIFDQLAKLNCEWVGAWCFDAGDYNSQFDNGERPAVGAAWRAAFAPPKVAAPAAPPAPTHSKTTCVQSATVARPLVVVASAVGWEAASPKAPIPTWVGSGLYQCVGSGSDGNVGRQLLFSAPVSAKDAQWGAKVAQG